MTTSYGTTVTLESNDPGKVLPGIPSGPLAELVATYAKEAGLAFDGVDVTVERSEAVMPDHVPALVRSTTIRLRLGGVPWVAVVRFDERLRYAETPLDLDRDAVRAGVEAILTGRPSSGAVALCPACGVDLSGPCPREMGQRPGCPQDRGSR